LENCPSYEGNFRVFNFKTKLEMPKKRKIFDQNKCGEESSCSKSTILKIGIISDTHGKSPDHTVLSQLFRDVQEIWHAGDIAGKDGSFESASAVISNLCRNSACETYCAR
jgi:hypothetical protein